MISKDTGFAGCLGYIVMLAFLMVVGIAAGAYVVMRLWEWFIVPFGAQPLGLAHAAGLSLIASYLTSGLKKDNDDYDKKPIGEVLTRGLIKAALAFVFFLVAGGIIASFMPQKI